MAAGKGTRMKSVKPKVCVEFLGKAMINRVVETALKFSDKIVVVVGYKANEVIATIPANDKIVFVEQKEQLGTGHAIITAKEAFENLEGDVIIMSGDVPLITEKTYKDILEHHKQNDLVCTVLSASIDDPARYGRVIVNKNGLLKKIVEYKDATEEEKLIDEINSGVYCYNTKELFNSLSEITNNNAAKEYYLTDTIAVLQSQNKQIGRKKLDDVFEITGINTPDQLEAAEIEFQRLNNL